MDALEIAALLVKPAAGMIYGPGGILFLYLFGNPRRVKLSPALVEGNPYCDGGHTVEMLYGVPAFLLPLQTAFLVGSGEEPVVMILCVEGCVGKNGGEVAHIRHVV